MRRLFQLLLCLCTLLTWNATGEECIIRLHVIADGNGKYEQNVKLAVRDQILAEVRELLRNASNPNQAYGILLDNQNRIRACAINAARENNYFGRVRVKMGTYPFPAKKYGNLLMKADHYRALRVEIGSAQGKNWWCILYPSLCYLQENPENGKIYFYSSLRTWLGNLLGGRNPI